jgi:hypothetical protein
MAVIVSVAVTIAGGTVIVRLSSADPGLCGAHPLSASAIPLPAGLRVIANRSVSPDCGASFTRWITIAGGTAAFDREVQLLAGRGWTSALCGTAVQRCFESPGRHYFVAIQAPRHSTVMIFVDVAEGLNP